MQPFEIVGAFAAVSSRPGADVTIVYLLDEQSDADEAKQTIENEGRRYLQIAGELIAVTDGITATRRNSGRAGCHCRCQHLHERMARRMSAERR